MTVQEINEFLKQIQTKINEIEILLQDINSCTGERSKNILLAAASKLTEQFQSQK